VGTLMVPGGDSIGNSEHFDLPKPSLIGVYHLMAIMSTDYIIVINRNAFEVAMIAKVIFDRNLPKTLCSG
jgi:hypothetical protein